MHGEYDEGGMMVKTQNMYGLGQRRKRDKMFIPFLDCVSLLMGWAVQLSKVLRGKGNRNTIEWGALHVAASCIITKQKISV